ncbi:MAG: trehalase family glycosidase [Clostridia bacterium]|jgi:alpha,alpha-trehalase
MDYTVNNDTVEKIKDYIVENMPKATIYPEKEPVADNVYPLRFSYTVPTVGQQFHYLFYWDTFFFTYALVHFGQYEQLKYNIENFFDLIDILGYVPNINIKSNGDNRSQPPFLANMVDIYYEHSRDKNWLSRAISYIIREYNFWMTQRGFDNGLNHYGVQPESEENLLGFYDYVNTRVKLDAETKEEKLSVARNFFAEAESGWDFTPRFEHSAPKYAAVDLNSNLYGYEVCISKYLKILGNESASKVWEAKANERKKKIQTMLFNKDKGFFMDYNVETGRFSPVKCAAGLFPAFYGIPTEKQMQTVVSSLSAIEFDYGISTCEDTDQKVVYQWDYPNGWPCMQIIAVEALDRYGYKEEALRIAKKYLYNICVNFEKSGHLWEKYNVVTGTLDVRDEYEMPAMLGWTAACFVFFLDYVNKKQ